MTVDEKTAVEAWKAVTVPKETLEFKPYVPRKLTLKENLITLFWCVVILLIGYHFASQQEWTVVTILGYWIYKYQRKKAQQGEVDNVP